MSPVQHRFDARPLLRSIRSAVGRGIERFGLALRGRRTSLDEETMPDWQLRDLGFRDGRETAARRSGRP